MIGRTISHYRIIGELGAGGMGVVYEAVDTNLDRTVALKFLPPETSKDPQAKARFIQEAKAASALDHPNVCTVFEVGEEDGRLFMAMARYEGEPLKDRISRGPLPIDEALDIIRQVAAGLAKAHDTDIVHRDIKPANIFLTGDGPVKILDFGLAKLADHTRLTKTGTTLGTGHYMSPEQAAGHETDPRSDVWALGVVLFEMVTGRVPFPGDHLQAVLYAIQNQDPEPVTGLRTGVPLELERIINKCLAKDPGLRYQGVADLLADLKALTQSATETMAVGSAPRPKPTRRYPIWAAAVALLIVLGVVGWRILDRSAGTEVTPGEYSLAVVDFQGLDPEADARLGVGLTELVNIGLIENCPIRVHSPEHLRDIRRREFGSGRGSIEEDQILEVARLAGATHVLSGRAGSVDDGRIVTWRLVEVGSGTSLEAGRIEGDALAALADDVVVGVVPVVGNLLGLDAVAATTTVEKIITADPEAYDHFLSGMLSMEDRDFPKACDEFLAAVAVDSTFALAHLELGRLYWAGDVATRDRERSQYHLEKARLFDTNLGSKDRLRLEAAEFDDRRELRNSLATLDKILERWPDDRQALLDKASIANRYWDMNEAVKTSERFLGLYPQDVHAVGALRSNGLMAIDSEENLRFARSMIRLHPREASSWSAMGNAHLALGQPDSALVAFSRANDLDPEYGREGARADCAYQAGDLGLAIKLMGEFLARPDISAYQRLWNTGVRTIAQGLSFFLVEGGQYQLAVEESNKADGAYFENPAAVKFEIAKTLIWWGNPAEGIAMLQERADEDPDWWSYFQPARLRARAAWRLDNRETLAEAAADLRRAEDRFGAMASILALQAEAELALLDERFGEALDKVAGARESGIPKPGMIWIEFHEAEARAFHGLGRLDEAIGVHEHILTLKGGHALSHFQLGRLHEEAGRREEAVRSFTTFLDMWRQADEDRPELAEARSALVRLMPD